LIGGVGKTEVGQGKGKVNARRPGAKITQTGRTIGQGRARGTKNKALGRAGLEGEKRGPSREYGQLRQLRRGRPSEIKLRGKYTQSISTASRGLGMS